MDERPMVAAAQSRHAHATDQRGRMAAIEGESVGDLTLPMSDELSRRRTGLSFQRTRLSADRTLMSVIRTALSLISFGFTISQLLAKMKDAGVSRGGPNAARNFGLALVLLGVGSLVVGIIYHLLFMRGLRDDRAELVDQGL